MSTPQVVTAFGIEVESVAQSEVLPNCPHPQRSLYMRLKRRVQLRARCCQTVDIYKCWLDLRLKWRVQLRGRCCQTVDILMWWLDLRLKLRVLFKARYYQTVDSHRQWLNFRLMEGSAQSEVLPNCWHPQVMTRFVVDVECTAQYT